MLRMIVGEAASLEDDGAGQSTTAETISTYEPKRTTTPFIYRVSPLLIDLGKTVDFVDALKREASKQE